MASIGKLHRKDAKTTSSSLGSIEAGVDELPCECDVLRAIVMTL
jgi:hypothetical protein